jgi:hypothetical protein
MPYFIGPEILLEAKPFNDLRTTVFRHLREQFGKLCNGEAVAEGFQFQDHYFSEDCIGDSIKNSSCFPSPERYAFSKIKSILWWPEGRFPRLNHAVCCPECHQYHHITLDGWMAIARVVVTGEGVYLLLGKSYRCGAVGCKTKSFNNLNSVVLNQLPSFILNQLPIFLTEKSGIEK